MMLYSALWIGLAAERQEFPPTSAFHIFKTNGESYGGVMNQTELEYNSHLDHGEKP